MNGFSKYKINVTDDTQTEKPLLVQGNTTILSRGNIACITGKAKSRKTFLVSAIAAAFLENETLTIKKGTNNATILLIDTEQAKSHVQKLQKRIYRLAGWNTYIPESRLTVLALRSLSSEERLTVTTEAIRSIHPDLIIIDGVRDLVQDFNDIKASANVVRQLMEISDTQNCGILTILHQNKSDNNARGHLGTELTNKSETVLQITCIGNKSIVSSDSSRNNNISQFAFSINENELPELSNIPKTNASKENIKAEIKQIIGQYKSISKQAFIAAYISKTNKKQSSAYIKLKQAINYGILIETNNVLTYNAAD